MANRYAVATGNWNSTDTWSDTDGGGSGASFPIAGDTVYLTATSGAITVTVNTGSACTVLNCTGFTGTLANSTRALTVAGNVTLPSGMTWTGSTGYIQVTDAATIIGGTAGSPRLLLSNTNTKTITSNGTTWGSITVATGAQTITLSDALVCGPISVTSNGNDTTFAGAFDITCSDLILGYNTNVTFVSGTTVTVTSGMYLYASPGAACTVKSSTESSSVSLAYSGVAADCKVFGMLFTDVAYSGSTVTGLDNWHGGTLTRTSGITNRTSSDIGGTGAGAWAHRMIGGGF